MFFDKEYCNLYQFQDIFLCYIRLFQFFHFILHFNAFHGML